VISFVRAPLRAISMRSIREHLYRFFKQPAFALGCIAMLAVSAAHAQDYSGSPAVASRLAQRQAAASAAVTATVNVTGLWHGNLQAPNDATAAAWEEEFDLRQDDSGNVTGTRKTTPQTNGTNWYIWSVTGTVSGNTLMLNDTTLVARGGGTNTPCQDTTIVNVTADGASFSGTWTAKTGCSPGTVSATRYGGDVARNLGSGALCDGGLGLLGGGSGSGSGASGNANGLSCPEKMGAARLGDPIDAGTGNYYLQEDDYTASYWLTFRRFYNSNGAVAPANLGFRWRHSFDRSLRLIGTPVATIIMLRPDGKQENFTKPGNAWVTDLPVDQLTEIRDGQGVVTGYSAFIGGSRETETYDSTGKLIQVLGQDGQGITLTYSTTTSTSYPRLGLLKTVTDAKGRKLTFFYDSSARLNSITLPDNKTLSYYYVSASSNIAQVTYPDSNYRLYGFNEAAYIGQTSLPNAMTGIQDENGARYETITYDNAGRATSSTFVGGVGATKIAYNADGSASVTYPLGNTVKIGMSSVAGLARVSSMDAPCAPDCGQHWKSRTYDSHGFPATYVDFKGITTQVTYDEYGLLLQTIEAVGTADQRTTTTVWDNQIRRPLSRIVLDSQGYAVASTGWMYNAMGQVLAYCESDPGAASAAGYTCSNAGTAPEGVRRTTYTYCTAVDTTQCPLVGLMLTATSPRTDVAQTTTYQYYLTDGTQWQHGDLKSVTNALGQVITFAAYDKNGLPTRTIDPNGVITDLSYNPRGWLLKRTVRANADGSASSNDAVTQFGYSRAGNLISVTDPDNVTITYGYDPSHRLTSIRNGNGENVTFTLDAAGNRTKEEVKGSNSVVTRSLTRSYNALGQLTGVQDALNRSVLSATYADSYDANGNLVHAADGLNVQLKRDYDALNRVIATTDDFNGSDQATRNTQTIYQYDALGRMAGAGDPDALNTLYDHNAFGDQVGLHSPDTGNSSAIVDKAGNATSVTDARGIQVNQMFDALNRRTSASYPSTSDNIAWLYDEPNSVTGCTGSYPIGRLTRVVEANVTTIYCYDKRGNVVRKSQTQGTQTDVVAYTYTLADRLAALTYPSGTMVAYKRDIVGRLQSLAVTTSGTTWTIVDSVNYMPLGPIASYMLGKIGFSQLITRTYDANYALTDISSSSLNLHFARDVMGNITALGSAAGANPATETYRYDALYRLNAISDATGAAIEAYTYNKTGDRLSKSASGLATGTYGYQSGTHWLTSIGSSARTYDANGNTTGNSTGGDAFGYGYNGRNRMTVVQRNGQTVANYSYNAMGQRVAKAVMAPQAANQRFAYDEGSQLLSEYGTTNRDYIWMGGLPVAVVDGVGVAAKLSYVTADELGTPRVIKDDTGAVQWQWPYQGNAFGEMQPVSATGYAFNLRLPGQYVDFERGLAYNTNRDYEPATGRYVQSDPIGLAAGWNTYAYAAGDPLTQFDFFGLALTPVDLPGLGATYLDDSFSPNVERFIANASAHGVELHFNSAYRTPAHQAQLHNDPNAITPADQSLHSCGFAVDVNYSTLPAAQQQIIREAAQSAGLSWGGAFRTPDPPHFFIEPSIDRATAIDNATRDYLRLTGQQH
jgi:RHS repeat-associated protein